MAHPAVQFDRAQAHIRRAGMLIGVARATRDEIRAQRRRCPVRRRLGLARGGSDTPLVETDRSRCPYCAASAITPAGRGVVRVGTIYVEVRCDLCRQPFLLLFAPERRATREPG